MQVTLITTNLDNIYAMLHDANERVCDQSQVWRLYYDNNTVYFKSRTAAESFYSAKLLIDDAISNSKHHWASQVKASGKSEKMYIATSNEATKMLAEYQIITESIKDEYGIDIQPLVDGVTVTFKD